MPAAIVWLVASYAAAASFETDTTDVVELERFGGFGSAVKFVYFSWFLKLSATLNRPSEKNGKECLVVKKAVFVISQSYGMLPHAICFLRVANQHTIDPKHTIPAPCQNVMDNGALITNDDTTADNTGMK